MHSSKRFPARGPVRAGSICGRAGDAAATMFRRAWFGARRFALATVAASAVEFALAMPVFMIPVAGIFEFGRYYWTRNSMQTALEESARMVMIKGTTAQDTVRDYLRQRVTAHGANTITVTVSTSISGSVNYATITATYTFQSIFGAFVPSLASRIISTSVKVPIVT